MRIRTLMTGLGMTTLLLLGLTTPARAIPLIYDAYTTNGLAYGAVSYSYTARGDGYYDIYVAGSSGDEPMICTYGADGWGAVIEMYYDTPTAAGRRLDIAKNRDLADGIPGCGNEITNLTYPIRRSKYKNVWFRVCNWYPATNERYSCARLRL